MQQALADESGRLVLELHRALSEIDPARWHAGAADAARLKLRAIEAKVAHLTSQSWPEKSAALRVKLAEVGAALAERLPREDITAANARARWMAFRKSMTPSYEALQATLHQLEIHVPSLRPTNHRRSLFHVLNAAVCMGILYAVPDPAWAIAISGPLVLWAWTMEIGRRWSERWNAVLMRAFAPIAHPHEWRRVNSATWYLTAIFSLSLTQAPLPCAVGLAVLGVGDPIAAFVGRRWGRIPLVHGRTLEGTLAFFAAASLFGVGAAFLFAPGIALGAALAIACAAGAAGALAELLSLRVDDNLSIPLVASGAAALVTWGLGL
ncbi:MAG: hypothetical protein VYE22_07780 [Myxococcota bacterium]|nr:hypothetical protein [Myxococcota bacterium]